MTHHELFELIRGMLNSKFAQRTKPLRVAVNGIEGVGKTYFAKDLVRHLNDNGQTAIHVTIDGFHHPKKIRYRQGRDSANGYYEDSYNEAAFVEKVLKASQDDPPQITRAIHDLDTDEILALSPLTIRSDSILVTDGAYLFKPVYLPHWDFKIYLKTDFDTALERGIKRDEDLLGGKEAAREKFQLRYHKASEIYLEEINPVSLSDMVIDNTDFNRPLLTSGN